MALMPEDDELLARAAGAAREEDPPADWPEPLKVALRILLTSRFHAPYYPTSGAI